MLNITFTKPAELLKPIELIREPMPGKDAPWLTAERDARSYKNLPLSAPAFHVSVAGRAHCHLGDGTGKGACPVSQGPPSSVDQGWEAEGPAGSYAAGVFFPPFSSAKQIEKTSSVFACLWRVMLSPVLMHEVCKEFPEEGRRSRACRGCRGSGERVKVTVIWLSP